MRTKEKGSVKSNAEELRSGFEGKREGGASQSELWLMRSLI